MIKHWEAGFDDVYAKRRTRGRESWLRRRLSLLFYKLLQSSSRFEVLQNVGDFRLLDRKCINALKKMRESERYTKGLYCWMGFKKKEITFDQGERYAGKSSFNFSRLMGLAVNGITSYTVAPLRISTILGFIVSICAFIYMLYVLIKTCIMGDPVQGFPTLVILILFLGGVQLLAIGIIGEYLARIYQETKHRPVYLISEKEGC
jgi:glycosyltransferase involved in cell wall biosynthesis